jgi:hypothetical protein
MIVTASPPSRMTSPTITDDPQNISCKRALTRDNGDESTYKAPHGAHYSLLPFPPSDFYDNPLALLVTPCLSWSNRLGSYPRPRLNPWTTPSVVRLPPRPCFHFFLDIDPTLTTLQQRRLSLPSVARHWTFQRHPSLSITSCQRSGYSPS